MHQILKHKNERGGKWLKVKDNCDMLEDMDFSMETKVANASLILKLFQCRLSCYYTFSARLKCEVVG